MPYQRSALQERVPVRLTQPPSHSLQVPLWKALQAAEKTLESISVKARFWQSHSGESFTEDQKTILNMLLDGTMRGQLTSSRWAKICKTSQDTAIRQIKDLQSRSILTQEGAGRSTHYQLTQITNET